MADRASFVFRQQAKPCAGDMRIAWRVSVTLVALLHSRAQRASFAKLHVLNDAICSSASREKLVSILDGKTPALNWRLRIEPAFTRALDFLVGEGFAEWSVANQRMSLALTTRGKEAARAVSEVEGALGDERAFLQGQAKRVTEQFVNGLTAAGRALL